MIGWFVMQTAAALPAETVAHWGTVEGESVVWSTRVAAQTVAPLAAVAFDPPLPAATQSEDTSIRLQRDASGEVVAAALVPPRRRPSFRLTMPLADGVLPVPFAAGVEYQRVTLRNAKVFPDAELALEKQVTRWTDPSLERPDCKHIDLLIGDDPLPREQPLYLAVGPELREWGGVPGELRLAGTVPAGVYFAGAFVLAGLGIGGAAIYRGLGSQARAEKNRAWIERNLG